METHQYYNHSENTNLLILRGKQITICTTINMAYENPTETNRRIALQMPQEDSQNTTQLHLENTEQRCIERSGMYPTDKYATTTCVLR